MQQGRFQQQQQTLGWNVRFYVNRTQLKKNSYLQLQRPKAYFIQSA